MAFKCKPCAGLVAGCAVLGGDTHRSIIPFSSSLEAKSITSISMNRSGIEVPEQRKYVKAPCTTANQNPSL